MPTASSPSPIEAADRRMGSEYSSARSYLAQPPRTRVVTQKRSEEPQHGSNDSDFGMLDQMPD